MKTKIKTNSKILIFLYRLLLLYSFFFFSRIIYLFSNIKFFPDFVLGDIKNILIGAFVFDSATMTYILAPSILLSLISIFLSNKIISSNLFQRLDNFIFLFVSIVSIIINVADAAYYPYILHRVDYSIFSEFADDKLISIIYDLAFSFWQYIVIIFLVVSLYIYLFFRVEYRDNEYSEYNKKRKTINLFTEISFFSLLILFFLYAVKGFGDLHNVPMTAMNANKYVNKSNQKVIVLNSVFTLIREQGKEKLENYNFYSEDTAKELFNPIYKAQKLSEKDSLFGSFSDYNIAIIILESFSAEYTSYYNPEQKNYPSYTPFLDSLATESFAPLYSFANGRKSVQAMPLILSSVPSMGMQIVSSLYNYVEIESLAKTLSKQNYYSRFYHGGSNGSMGFDAFVKSISYNSYFGRNEYDDDRDFDGLWGIFDEKFLSKVADNHKELKRPYLSTIFTLSSHSPYTVPEEYKNTYNRGTLKMHNVIEYSDMALKKFFNKMKTLPDYEKTLFIITADHASDSNQPIYQNVAGRYRVPIIFFDAEGRLKSLSKDKLMQHSDIFPSLLYLMGNQTPIISFGNNVFDNNSLHYAIEKENDIYYMFSKNFIINFDPYSKKYNIEKPTKYILTDSLSFENWNNNIEYEKAIDTLKGFIQNYNSRIINNNMSINK